jgi:nucleotide-binding universal stress UspA family protein
LDHAEVLVRQQPDCYHEQLESDLRSLQQLQPDSRIEPRLEDGDPAKTILQVAWESSCDLILMGTHERSG